MNIEHCKAYRLISTQDMKDMGTKGYLLEHNKTKAKVVLMENQDENKVFTIGFRTPPKDSTGVAHIVEHTVLCGSKEFPVKDPFIELAKGSLNTFLNAMTYPDKTVYPVASCNDKDFQNLMHVYLDAVFYPNIYKEEKIFKQEGWHYELESEEAPLKYNGVVFNEMKGVYSDPDSILYRNIQNALFPDTPYGVESGGDPVEIPELTYEDYLDFHSKYYHPSNSYIYLYGDMDMGEKLNWLEEKYLSQFDYLFVDSALPMQKSFDKKQEKYGFYSVPEGDDSKDKVYHSLNFAYGTFDDRKLYRGMQVLEYVLLDAVGAPVKQALLDAGIGSEIKGGFENGLQQMSFTFIAKNARQDQKQDFEKVIYDTLTELAEKGLDRKSLLAALNAMEFQYREGDFGNYPKGLMYGLQMFDSWLYDDKKPFIHLDCGDVFEELRKAMDTDYYEQLIRDFFLDNTHVCYVGIEPKAGLTAKMDQEEQEKLDQYKETLTPEQIQKLVQETKELKVYQEEPTSPEALKCIPLLTREDLGKKVLPVHNEVNEMQGVTLVEHDYPTNGIEYLRLIFSVDQWKEYAPYLGLLTDILGTVDTEKHDKLALSNEILIHAGNFEVEGTAYGRKGSDEYSMHMEVGSKMLYREIPYMMELLGEILTQSKMGDTKRLREIIGEARSGQQASKLAAGHLTACRRVMSYLGERQYYVEQMSGIGYYDFLCDLEEHFEERKDNLIAVLTALMKNIFVKEDLEISVTATEEGREILKKELSTLLEALPQQAGETVPEPDWKLPASKENEGFKTASKVQFVARAGHFDDKGIEYDGSFRVVKTILSYDYLWNEVRVKGGAYGVMCSFAQSGTGYFMSYRDPNLTETNEVYKGVPAYLEHFDADERDMMKYMIGTISEMDTPLTPRAKGSRSYRSYKTGYTEADMQTERDQVLATDQKKVREAAKMVEAILSDDKICVLGGEEKVEEAKELFDTVRVLN